MLLMIRIIAYILLLSSFYVLVLLCNFPYIVSLVLDASGTMLKLTRGACCEAVVFLEFSCYFLSVVLTDIFKIG